MLTARQKFLLNEDAQVLVEAGFLNMADGSITEAGRSALWLIVMTKFAKEFQDSAKAVIEERTAKEAK